MFESYYGCRVVLESKVDEQVNSPISWDFVSDEWLEGEAEEALARLVENSGGAIDNVDLSILANLIPIPIVVGLMEMGNYMTKRKRK
ncbi:hypothetical protein VNO78_03670 [Psophocarpus tetragonolobus]|uniref:Uncharacterized protein n=1 Tax=Psophocarpus tetragonolobus TaxID=3891 RepID=A0AAN9TEL0_PSOTE